MGVLAWWRQRAEARQTARLAAYFQTLQDQEIGVESSWGDTSITPEDVALWCDDYMGDSPRVPTTHGQPEAEVFRFVVYRCEELSWINATELPLEHLLIVWEGSRMEWWQAGRDRMIAAMPAVHQGLYIAGNSAGRVIAAMLAQSRTKNGA